MKQKAQKLAQPIQKGILTNSKFIYKTENNIYVSILICDNCILRTYVHHFRSSIDHCELADSSEQFVSELIVDIFLV